MASRGRVSAARMRGGDRAPGAGDECGVGGALKGVNVADRGAGGKMGAEGVRASHRGLPGEWEPLGTALQPGAGCWGGAVG